MKRYMKLVNFEFNRFLKFYLVLIGMTFLLQMIGVIVESRNYMNKANELMTEELMSKSEFVRIYGTMSFHNITATEWFLGLIALCGVVLISFVFIIWYRDWLGKNTFSYRLLVLPTARFNIYLAKATTILIFLLGLVAFQFLSFSVDSLVLQWLVPDEFRTDLSVQEITVGYSLAHLPLVLWFPRTFIEFILYYGGGMIIVLIGFTAILFERSFRLKGIFYGLIYSAVSLLILLTPIYLLQSNYFYPTELVFLEIGAGLIVLMGAIWIGNFLLKNKIRV
ncbi:hypothetical protein [Bacillus solimangrovi]|uniref:Uncharacterized protein n=1 Tax=Bacillus solimangrovi TaxID=1305675 RepID=A0A1E5LKJ1_9BACI|nr:hypothetical protein [Bacillus solimangrovi]OEH94556.1 hypothetical protein BFG57_07770 [Bacillus solimangrovi]